MRRLLAMVATGVVAVCVAVVVVAVIRAPGAEPEPAPALDDGAALDQAGQVLIRDCMRALGFEYLISPPAEPSGREFPYVLDDPEWAAANGYGGPPEPDDANPNQSYYARQEPGRAEAALRAIHGERSDALTARTPDGTLVTRGDTGCKAEADAELYGDLAAWFQAETVVRELPPLKRSRVLADPRYAEAVRPWAGCMSAQGHSYATPADTRAVLPLPAEAERTLAVAEADCALSSGLAATAAALDREHGDLLNREFQSEVDTEERMRADALPRARAVLAATR